MAFATVKPSSLTPAAREVLAVAPPTWQRMPAKHATIVVELASFGLVETRLDWEWSKSDPGAGRHVTYWRLTPAAAPAPTKE